MQTCLEKEGISARQAALVRNDYNLNDEYSSTHSDALSNGDPQGKGTGNGGHGHYLPDCNMSKNMYNYSNLDTTGGGGSYDINGRAAVNNGMCGREYLKAISVYNEGSAYGPNLVDTTLNRQDGQIVV